MSLVKWMFLVKLLNIGDLVKKSYRKIDATFHKKAKKVFLFLNDIEQ